MEGVFWVIDSKWWNVNGIMPDSYVHTEDPESEY